MLFLKPRSIVVPDFCVEVADPWMVFPWEVATSRETARKGDLGAVNYLESCLNGDADAVKLIQQILGVSMGEDSRSV